MSLVNLFSGIQPRISSHGMLSNVCAVPSGFIEVQTVGIYHTFCRVSLAPGVMFIRGMGVVGVEGVVLEI